MIFLKIIIVGDGKIGSTLARQLSAEGCDIILVDMDAKVLESSLQKYDIMTIAGNGATMETLKQADVVNANVLIAVTTSDEINLLSCLTAHKLNADIHTIARIRNPEYTEQAYLMRDIFGLSLIINPERQYAREISHLIRYPGFLKRDSFAKGRVEIVEVMIDESSLLCQRKLSELHSIINCKVLVCAVLRDGRAIIPAGDFVLKANDKIFVTAASNELSTLLKNLNIITHKAKTVIVAGGGTDSYYLAESLKNSGISVKIIEQNHDRCLQLATLLPWVEIIHGDATNQQLLEEEGISNCDVFVSLTGVDELNMFTSLFASTLNVPQIITKIGRIENPKMLSSLMLGSVVSPKELSCYNIVRYVRAIQNKQGAANAIHLIADGQVEAIEFIIDESVQNCSIPFKNLKIRKNVLIVCITNGTSTQIPNGESSYKKGDTVIVVAGSGVIIRQFNDIFE